MWIKMRRETQDGEPDPDTSSRKTVAMSMSVGETTEAES